MWFGHIRRKRHLPFSQQVKSLKSFVPAYKARSDKRRTDFLIGGKIRLKMLLTGFSMGDISRKLISCFPLSCPTYRQYKTCIAAKIKVRHIINTASALGSGKAGSGYLREL